MKKLTLFFFALLAVCLAFQACDNSKTYAEMLEEEKDAIKAFIKDSSIVVISQSEFYAQDSTTDVSRNEYVQLASGVYMQIVDKGSTNPADTIKPNDLVLVRYRAAMESTLTAFYTPPVALSLPQYSFSSAILRGCRSPKGFLRRFFSLSHREPQVSIPLIFPL